MFHVPGRTRVLSVLFFHNEVMRAAAYLESPAGRVRGRAERKRNVERIACIHFVPSRGYQTTDRFRGRGRPIEPVHHLRLDESRLVRRLYRWKLTLRYSDLYEMSGGHSSRVPQHLHAACDPDLMCRLLLAFSVCAGSHLNRGAATSMPSG